MASLHTKFTVGLFFVAGVSIAIVAVIWLGMSHYLEEGHYYVAYFDESVQGLGNDSPVKYRGVAIGRVISINVAPDGNLIEVVFRIESGLKPGPDMIARLKSIGITGIMFVELERSTTFPPPDTPKITFRTEYPVVRTQRSDIKKIFDSIENVLAQVEGSDISGLIHRMNATVTQINQAVADAHVADISSDIRSTLLHAQEIVDPRKWEKIIASLETEIASVQRLTSHADKTISAVNQIITANQKPLTESVAGLNQAVEKAVLLMDNSNHLVSSADTAMVGLHQSLTRSAEQIESAGKKLNIILDITTAQPSQLFLGNPQEERQEWQDQERDR